MARSRMAKAITAAIAGAATGPILNRYLDKRAKKAAEEAEKRRRERAKAGSMRNAPADTQGGQTAQQIPATPGKTPKKKKATKRAMMSGY